MGAVSILAVVLAGAAVLAVPTSGPRASRVRLLHVLPPSDCSTEPVSPHRPPDARSRRVMVILAAGSLALLVGGMAGVLCGVVVAIVLERVLSRLEPRAVRRRRERLAADLPVAADLLAACLLAGSTLADAAESVAAALDGPLREALSGVVAAVRLGADPASAWLSLAEEAALAPLARAVARAVESGAPLAETMARLADDQRGERRRAAAAAAQRVGVRAVMPLGACFLPAFVLLGVAPVVGGIARQVLSG